MSQPDPIQARYREGLNALANFLDDHFNSGVEPKRVGFVLLMAEFGKIEGGRVNYISNGSRDDMIAMMKEMIARAEGRYSSQSGTA
jgi:hypothetical protein